LTPANLLELARKAKQAASWADAQALVDDLYVSAHWRTIAGAYRCQADQLEHLASLAMPDASPFTPFRHPVTPEA